MKIIQLIVASFVAISASANLTLPLIFFAKIKNTLIPLSGTFYNDGFQKIKALTYSNKYPIPAEFALQNNYAVTKSDLVPEFAGFYNGVFSFGDKMPKTRLTFDSEMKLNGSFYSCKLFNGPVHGILNRRLDVPKKQCFDVDIYLLPYGKVPEVDKKVPVFLKNYVHSPMAFFVKIKDGFLPLHAHLYHTVAGNINLLVYGDSSALPIEFILKNNQAVTSQTSTPGYVGFYEDGFAFAPFINATRLDFDSQGRILNGHFYSCEFFDHVHWIHLGVAYEDYNRCFEVNIYLLPYNRTTRSVVKPLP